MQLERLIFAMELVGTAAFAWTGAVAAIRKRMDVFGVVVLAVVTALGGGLIRDTILGINPPNMFRNPVYALLSVVCALLLFTVLYTKPLLLGLDHATLYARLVFACDTIGLGVFTVVGIDTAIQANAQSGRFLLCFVGVLTGVGGGVVRDLLLGVTPYIFVKHIYACASMVGAVCCVLLWVPAGRMWAMLVGAAVVVTIRCLAALLRLNLPKIRIPE